MYHGYLVISSLDGYCRTSQLFSFLLQRLLVVFYSSRVVYIWLEGYYGFILLLIQESYFLGSE